MNPIEFKLFDSIRSARKDRHLDAALLIPPGDGESHWKVASYTTEGVFYELATEGGNGVNGKFVSCSCLV